ncbi:MAG: hypothetical protein AABY07_00815 [Nanoarchaeota archaeon]
MKFKLIIWLESGLRLDMPIFNTENEARLAGLFLSALLIEVVNTEVKEIR